MPGRNFFDPQPWVTGDAGHSFRRRHVERPICGQRRFSGSHIACALNFEHAGPHESADGDKWE